MKKIISIIALFSATLLSMPALSVTEQKNFAEEYSESEKSSLTISEYSGTVTENKKNNSKAKETTVQKDTEYFSVLDAESGQVLEVPVRDYIIGAVCAEMPASFHKEALKAQAVASHTYALYQKDVSSRTKDDSLKGADFSNDCSKYQAYFTEDEIRKYYGDSFDTYYAKVAEAVDEAADKILVYDSEPIVAAFHSMSSGTTESAANIWGRDIAYLVPQESSSDKDAPGYTEQYTFSADELRSRLETEYDDIEFEDDLSEWFDENKVSSSGTVLELKAGNKIIEGMKFRELLSIRSAAFDIEYDGESKFCITTRGFGHGVGMSQYGANSMAESGKTYDEILMHYYENAELISVS